MRRAPLKGRSRYTSATGVFRPDRTPEPLESALRRHFPGARMETLHRSLASRRSSWWLEDVSVVLDDGSTVGLVLKTPGREAPGSGARALKPGRVAVPWREEWVYRELFARTPPGPPTCYAVVRTGDGCPGLLLERVDGVPLAEVAGGSPWLVAAAWLGRFHARPWRVPGGNPLLLHDRALHRWWFQRAVEALGAGSGAAARERQRRLMELELAHTRALRALENGPATVLHGEFHASNVVVESTRRGVRIRPVDWEMAGFGPPLMDLAALTAGRWARKDRSEMAMAYRHAALAAGTECPPLDRFLWNLDACGLLLAVQWLGWSRDWSPPPEHRTDWLEEAVRSAEGLGA